MGFISEYASQDDINKYKLDELWNKYNRTDTIYDCHWTINKETGSWLMPTQKHRNSKTIWILHYKNTNIEVKLYKTVDGWDLTSISSNSFNNQEIIECIQEALKVLETTTIIWTKPKNIKSKEDKKEIQIDVKEPRTKKITYLDIVVLIIVLVILFFVANDNNRIQTTKALYDIYSVIQTANDKHGIFGINKEDLNTQTEILSFSEDLSTCKIDKYGNMYWKNITKKSIYKADPYGTNIIKIATAYNGLGGIAIDNKHEKIYWIRRLDGKKYSEIVYTDFSGKNEHIVVSNKSISTTTRGMFYDYIYDKLYFTDWSSKGIMVIDLKTKEIKKLAYSSSSDEIVLDYKNRRIIWTNAKNDNISSSNFDGSDIKVLIQFESTLSNPDGITIDTINERLIYGYYSSVDNEFILETSNLDGTKKKIEKKSFYKANRSLFFVNNLSYKNGDI